MTHAVVPAAANLPFWGVWGALGVFLVAHVSLLIAFSTESLDADAFHQYAYGAEVATHVFAVPAIVAKNIEGIREQIVVATLVSTVFHTLNNYFGDSVDVHPWNCLDRGVATALIATVFLKYLAHVHRTDGILVFVAALASSFEFGNVLASSLVSLVLVAILFLPFASEIVQSALRGIISFLSFGGSPELDFSPLNFNASQRTKLLWTLGLQILSVAAYLTGENITNLEHWAHSIWHAFAYLALYLLVLVLVEEKTKLRDELPRASRKDFSNIMTRQKAKEIEHLVNFRMM
jgi:hypothetical protein